MAIFFPAAFAAIAGAEVANVNLVVAALIWLMIIPMLVKIDFSAWRRGTMMRLPARGIANCFSTTFSVLCAIIPTNAIATESLDGLWMDSDGEVILEIGPCGTARCGKVAWLKQPLGPDGHPLRDYHNPNPELQKRPVCGLQVVSGFKKQGNATWGDGTVYVSDQGMSYSGYAEVLSPTQVKVTGYVGLTIFGASEIWTKVTKPLQRCWVTPVLSGWTTTVDAKSNPIKKSALPH